jgi:uncharacterized membrane protein
MNLLFAVPILISGLTFVICGYILKKYPPAQINMWYGYRTSSSRKNSDTWAVGNVYSANLFISGGIIFTCLGLISFALPDMGLTGAFIAQGLLIGFIIILIAATEMHLNKLFDKDGNRKI